MFNLDQIFAARAQQQRPMTTPSGYYQGQTQVVPAVATGRADNPTNPGINMVPSGTDGTTQVAAGTFGGEGQQIPEGATSAPAGANPMAGMAGSMITGGLQQAGDAYAKKQLAEGLAQQKAVPDLPEGYQPILANYQVTPTLQPRQSLYA